MAINDRSNGYRGVLPASGSSYPDYQRSGLGGIGFRGVYDPDAPNDFGIGRNTKHYAENTQAALLRANWDESRARLSPLIDSLSYEYQNPQGRDEMVQSATQDAGTAFDKSLRSSERTMKGLGIGLTPVQQQSFDASANVASGLSRIGAKNMASRGYDATRQQIATGA